MHLIPTWTRGPDPCCRAPWQVRSIRRSPRSSASSRSPPPRHPKTQSIIEISGREMKDESTPLTFFDNHYVNMIHSTRLLSLSCMWSALRLVIMRLRLFMRSVAEALALEGPGASLPLRMTRSGAAADIWNLEATKTSLRSYPTSTRP